MKQLEALIAAACAYGDGVNEPLPHGGGLGSALTPEGRARTARIGGLERDLVRAAKAYASVTRKRRAAAVTITRTSSAPPAKRKPAAKAKAPAKSKP